MKTAAVVRQKEPFTTLPIYWLTSMASTRYSVAELYGFAAEDLSPKRLKSIDATPVKERPCPFRGGPCNKPGGVCSLRLYENDNGAAVAADKTLVTTCPNRFKELGMIFQWVSEQLIGTTDPKLVLEVPFLTSPIEEGEVGGDAVGKIDMVLANTDGPVLQWCALELQAVYFSGSAMPPELAALRTWKRAGIPFPLKIRRPDFRSSGPKRLMPQLQVKVPTLRRWGKKMAVVIDSAFRTSLGHMETVPDISNCDIVWFVVDYKYQDGRYMLVQKSVEYTTLDRAVEGLTNGVPVPLPVFETRLVGKLNARPKRGPSQ